MDAEEQAAAGGGEGDGDAGPEPDKDEQPAQQEAVEEVAAEGGVEVAVEEVAEGGDEVAVEEAATEGGDEVPAEEVAAGEGDSQAPGDADAAVEEVAEGDVLVEEGGGEGEQEEVKEDGEGEQEEAKEEGDDVQEGQEEGEGVQEEGKEGDEGVQEENREEGETEGEREAVDGEEIADDVQESEEKGGEGAEDTDEGGGTGEVEAEGGSLEEGAVEDGDAGTESASLAEVDEEASVASAVASVTASVTASTTGDSQGGLEAAPVGFKVIAKLPEGEFSLDPAYNENELHGEQRASVLSLLGEFGFYHEAGRRSVGVSGSAQSHGGEGRSGASRSRSASASAAAASAAEKERSAQEHLAHTRERSTLTRRNKVLQRKLMEHFKKRKMEEVFLAGEEVTPELEGRYLKRLGAFRETQEAFEEAVADAAAEEAMMTRDEQTVTEQLEDLVDMLLAVERDTVVALVEAKAGRPISEKAVDRLLGRQRTMIAELGDTRLVYIRTRDKVHAKMAAIKEMEDLGQNLSMMDYEQLRMENQNLVDKLEEKDDEVARLRARAVHSIQVLAHFKEKAGGVVRGLDAQIDLLQAHERKLEAARSELNQLKMTRDRLRSEFARETAEAGLLTKPQLLRAFEQTQDACAVQRDKLRACADEVARDKQQLDAVREAAARGAAVEVEMKPKNRKRPTYVDMKTARRRKASAANKPPATGDDYIFQL